MLTHICCLFAYPSPPSHPLSPCSTSQGWEETAAQYVSIKPELSAVAALATRWRRLELSSWQGTLRRVAAAHAAGANKSWFHLHLLLLQQDLEQGQAGVTSASAVGSGLTSITAAAVLQEGPGSTAAEGGMAAEESWYRRTASTLEMFMQTSTLGEYGARLGLLRSFQAHLRVGGRVCLGNC
jgi:midasin